MKLSKHLLNMSYALRASHESTCHNSSEGTLILIGNIRFIGYTGNLPKQKHCKEIFNDSNHKFPCNCMSAEKNAIAQIIRSAYPVSTANGGILYTTDTITLDKINEIATYGINEIYYLKEIEDPNELVDITSFADFNDIKVICLCDSDTIISENVNDIMFEVNQILKTK